MSKEGLIRSQGRCAWRRDGKVLVRKEHRDGEIITEGYEGAVNAAEKRVKAGGDGGKREDVENNTRKCNDVQGRIKCWYRIKYAQNTKVKEGRNKGVGGKEIRVINES